MRLLLILTALMLAIAGGVWWKTTRTPAGDPDGALKTDPNLGIATFGVQEPAPAAPPAPVAAAAAGGDLALPGEAALRNPHERATTGDPKEPPTAANEAPAVRPAAPAQPPAAAPAGSVQHVVRSGETLYGIVKKAYGSASPELIADVAKANGLKDPGALKVGQKLTLPTLAGHPAPR